MTALSSWCRDPASGPAAFIKRAASLGAQAVALDASLGGDELEGLVVESLRNGLPAVALEAPCPRPPGRRPPRLASEDREERLAAARALEATLQRAAELSARFVVVRLGALEVRHDFGATLRAFARRTLTEDAVARIIEGRRSLSPRAVDLARYGLDLVAGAAAAANVTLGLANRARWFEIPSAAELAALLDDFRGAPLAPWYDAAAAHVRRALGFGAGRPALELEGACGAWLSDAAGPRAGLPWGLGDIDAADILARLPKTALRVSHCAPGATDEELAATLL